MLLNANDCPGLDNWLLERCADTAENGAHSSSSHTNNSKCATTAAVGVQVKLIDFGRSLSVTHSSHTNVGTGTNGTIDKSSANKGTRHTNPSAQLAALTALYQPVVADAATAVTHMNNLGKPEVVYQGDISAKGYKCAEMEQNQPWNYQVCNFCVCSYLRTDICKVWIMSFGPRFATRIPYFSEISFHVLFSIFISFQTDLHGLCSCIHQLLHLMPLTLYLETTEQCRQRGLAIDNTVNLITLHSTIESGGKADIDRSQLVPQLERKEFLVPQATLKRYSY